MEHQKTLSLLNEPNDFKFVTRKWTIVNYDSKSNYAAANEFTYNTEVLKSNLCDYNDAYILVRCDITIIGCQATQKTFKNCAPFTKCITLMYQIEMHQIDGTIIVNAVDLDLVMPMYNLIEYNSSYSETTGSLWFYSKDEATGFNADIATDNNFKFFMYKAKLLGNTVAQPARNTANRIFKNSTTDIPLKNLTNFWRSLEMPLINCKVELKKT